ncbi:MAG TPA: flavodoxin family protein [Coriobacteriia bacterium]|jgi:multimeric flavodoxin WrbA
MKVLGVNGSARKDGNTAILIRKVFEPLEAAGIECELVQLAHKRIHGCTACRKCAEERIGNCVGVRDDANEIIAKMVEADGILLGSPTYFADLSAEMKALIDRGGYSALSNGGLLKRKVGAAVVAVRRGGGIHVFDSINHLFFISQMIVPGSSYWNLAYGREPGEVEADEEGMRTMRVLGENMAWLLEKLHA